ncbi:MAG: hypothetical protein U0263_17480 [Polyangiaceae bacterium]
MAVGAPIVQKDLLIESACTANVDIVAFDLRDGSEFVPVSPGPAQPPLAIAPGAQATLRVGFKGLTPELTDDFVRIRFTSPTGRAPRPGPGWPHSLSCPILSQPAPLGTTAACSTLEN